MFVVKFHVVRCAKLHRLAALLALSFPHLLSSATRLGRAFPIFAQNETMKYLVALSLSLVVGAMCAQSFNQIEAVEYDELNNRFLVTNNSSIISRLPDGSLEYFGDGNKASYGMEIVGNTLFAAHSTFSGNWVYGYDLTSEEEVMELEIPSADFLNGMGTDGVSRLWVSDFGGERIYEIDVTDIANPSYSMVANTPNTPNGVVYDEINDRVLIVTWGSNAPILQMDPSTYEVTTAASTSLAQCDGIDNDGENNFFVSSWNPTRITKFNEDFTTSEIITAPGLSSPADISYAVAIDTLAVANSGNETLTLIDFNNTIDINETGDNPMGFNVFPNPVNQSSKVSFNLKTSTHVVLNVMDTSGKIAAQLVNEKLSAGHHHVLMTGIQLTKGYYIYEIQAEESVLHFPFLVH